MVAPFFCQRYVNGAAPVARTENVAAFPARTVCPVGCRRMTGAVAAGATDAGVDGGGEVIGAETVSVAAWLVIEPAEFEIVTTYVPASATTAAEIVRLEFVAPVMPEPF